MLSDQRGQALVLILLKNPRGEFWRLTHRPERDCEQAGVGFLRLSPAGSRRRQGYARSDPRAMREAPVSLPSFSTQAALVSTAGFTSNLVAPTYRYRLLAQAG